MKIELRKTSDIKPYPGNPRVNDSAVDAVARSLAEFGFRQPIVVDNDGVIVVGHTRWKAAQKLGLKQVPVHFAKDLTEAQAKAYRLADNKSAELAEWDKELLPLELAQLHEMQFDLNLTGFNDDELTELFAPPTNEGLCDPDEAPTLPDEPVTKPGDLYVLGNHRLLCGDATCCDDVARLVDQKKARMLFTDPPWNVAIGQDANPRHRQRKGLINDSLPTLEFQALLDGFIAAAVAHVKGDVYCILGASEWPRLDASLRAAGFHWSATIIWAKDTFVLGRSKYHRRYEPIWYGWHRNCRSSFTDQRNLDDVWEIPRPKISAEHPTMKPVELAARAMNYSSRPGENVLDLFGGSGSTLIAAEQTGRRAFLMELDPLYCDVIMQRFEKFTGQKADRLSAAEV